MTHATISGRGVIAGLAVALGAVGAAQLAFGHDLDSNPASTSISNHDVNRTGKADRAPRVTTIAPAMRTISVTVSGLSGASVVMHVPLKLDAGNSAPTSLVTTSTPPKPAIACEPVVSVLTDVAKQLQPGRCVT